ncbi:MAG TPA: TlpA disulfide reductase family protein [Terriglobales bacterium]|nr:TlpA disulfide reductase family protein [Terriglobales bacterium]
MPRKLLVALFILAIAVGVYFGFRPRRRTPVATAAAGNTATLGPAPDFTLKAISGQPLTLADYKGKVVLLDFWATWCAPCRAEIPKLVGWQKQYGPQGLQVIGISMDDSEKPVPGFVQQFGIDYPVAVGDAKLADAYGGVLGLPVTFVIGRDGQIYHKHVGGTDLPQIEEEFKQLLQK